MNYHITQARIQEFSSGGGGGFQPSEKILISKKKKKKKNDKSKGNKVYPILIRYK